MNRACRSCNQEFLITEGDLEFYDKVSPVFNGVKCTVPPPTLCPPCRERRRMAWRNERKWYNGTCGKCSKAIVTLYRPDTGYVSYCHAYWWSQDMDPLQYGVAYDPGQSFNEQFLSLEKRMPHLALMNDDGVASENCEYTQDFAFGKNCFLVVGSWNVRDSLYSTTVNQNTSDAMDCEYLHESHITYECQYGQKLYDCTHLRNSEDCNGCRFGFDLKGCSDCFGCVGLRHKQYCIFNRQYSKEEYLRIMNAIDLSSHAVTEEMKRKFAAFLLTVPQRAAFMNNCENCQGDNLMNCKDTFGYDLYGAQDCRYFTRCDTAQYCYDILQSGKPQWCLEGLTPDESYMSHFVQWTWKCRNVLYSDNCHSSESLFACVGLKRAKYCILNRQYTKEEYEALVPKIIAKMKEDGEWGEFFDPKLSPFGYNETVAMEYYPLTKEEALKLGFNWSDYVSPPPQVERIVKAEQLPDSILDVPDAILEWAVECEVSGRPFRIIKQELKFLREHGLPLPRRHPDLRHMDRMKLRNPRKLFDRTCMKCSKPIQTTYAPERTETVYCEECYLKEVY